jgi:hypothetical protein
MIVMPTKVMHLRNPLRRRAASGTRGRASVAIGGMRLTDVILFRKSTGGALSKAGHLAWRANLEGRPVKISEYPSEEIARLLETVCADPVLARHFPSVIVRLKRYVISEWVAGETVSAKIAARDDATLSEIAWLQARIHRTSLSIGETSPSYRTILESRFKKYAAVLPLERFHERVKVALDAAEVRLPAVLSHPDLTPANLIRDARTGDLMVVDNELMTSHRFPHADLLNTYHSLRSHENGNLADHYLAAWRSAGGDAVGLATEAEAYGALWALRKVGSDLQRGALAEALAVANAYLTRQLPCHPLIHRARQD